LSGDCPRNQYGRNKERPRGGVGFKPTQNRNEAMTKTFEVISEAIRNPKPPFRKMDNQPKKPMKHRYERRKIKEYLHLTDWQEEVAT
jgi:hypothetical protein